MFLTCQVIIKYKLTDGHDPEAGRPDEVALLALPDPPGLPGPPLPVLVVERQGRQVEPPDGPGQVEQGAQGAGHLHERAQRGAVAAGVEDLKMYFFSLARTVEVCCGC